MRRKTLSFVITLLGFSISHAKITGRLTEKHFEGSEVLFAKASAPENQPKLDRSLIVTAKDNIRKQVDYRVIENDESNCVFYNEWTIPTKAFDATEPVALEGQWKFNQKEPAPTNLWPKLGQYPLSFSVKDDKGHVMKIACGTKPVFEDVTVYKGEASMTSYYFLMQSQGVKIKLKDDEDGPLEKYLKESAAKQKAPKSPAVAKLEEANKKLSRSAPVEEKTKTEAQAETPRSQKRMAVVKHRVSKTLTVQASKKTARHVEVESDARYESIQTLFGIPKVVGQQ